VTAAAVVFAVLVLAFGAVARGLGRVYVTAPIAFVIAGAVISVVAPIPVQDSAVEIRVVAEVTLALILFHDAAQVRPRQIQGDRGLVLRLLLVGLPLTVVAGFVGARLVFPAMPVMVALLLAAALAPTDAGLGAATVLNPVVPVRVRRVLNVESGLNDGLITPVVLFAIAFGLATDYGVFLLTRIREAWESGLANREAVAVGLERTGRIITAAALLFCIAVGSFATSQIILVKEIGVGIALAVLIDASIVRALLVPALMALLGRWNWWPRSSPRASGG